MNERWLERNDNNLPKLGLCDGSRAEVDSLGHASCRHDANQLVKVRLGWDLNY